jgi:hypothetical protein
METKLEDIEVCAGIPEPAVDKTGKEYIICVKVGGSYVPPHFYVFPKLEYCIDWEKGWPITFKGNLLNENKMLLSDPPIEVFQAVKSKLAEVSESGMQYWEFLIMLWNYSNRNNQIKYTEMPENLFDTVKRLKNFYNSDYKEAVQVMKKYT